MGLRLINDQIEYLPRTQRFVGRNLEQEARWISMELKRGSKGDDGNPAFEILPMPVTGPKLDDTDLWEIQRDLTPG